MLIKVSSCIIEYRVDIFVACELTNDSGVNSSRRMQDLAKGAPQGVISNFGSDAGPLCHERDNFGDGVFTHGHIGIPSSLVSSTKVAPLRC